MPRKDFEFSQVVRMLFKFKISINGPPTLNDSMQWENFCLRLPFFNFFKFPSGQFYTCIVGVPSRPFKGKESPLKFLNCTPCYQYLLPAIKDKWGLDAIVLTPCYKRYRNV